MKKQPRLVSLTTSFENDPALPDWSVYPRPQLRRQSYLCLNGAWEFGVTTGPEPEKYDRRILVPYPPQSALSGVGEDFEDGESVWYRRSFTLPPDFRRQRIDRVVRPIRQPAEGGWPVRRAPAGARRRSLLV